MKKMLIGSLVGGLILFIWQFLSWGGPLKLHDNMQQYTPKQQEILDFLDKNLEEGFYFLPNVPQGTSAEEYAKYEKENAGKPWAQVFYHKANTTNMPMNMARGFLVDIIAVALLVWILSKMAYPNFQTILLCSIAVGLIGYLTGIYTNSIWFETKVLSDLIDAVVGYGLVGAWLGWWLRK
jgi:hypothetical protein